ncbi:hypothetical protein E2C01_021975 [Portunus trituberculatus]|uniref:Uncharacterized protein n=1 Tax=Portunus trituberculatus TaxID=210409 RepID=A0A5B7E7P7_PORTR|nr:hypothetical protein [Portunus trituberculatus]
MAGDVRFAYCFIHVTVASVTHLTTRGTSTSHSQHLSMALAMRDDLPHPTSPCMMSGTQESLLRYLTEATKKIREGILTQQFPVRVHLEAGNALVEVWALYHPRQESVSEGLIKEHDGHDVGVAGLSCYRQRKVLIPPSFPSFFPDLSNKGTWEATLTGELAKTQFLEGVVVEVLVWDAPVQVHSVQLVALLHAVQPQLRGLARVGLLASCSLPYVNSPKYCTKKDGRIPWPDNSPYGQKTAYLGASSCAASVGTPDS